MDLGGAAIAALRSMVPPKLLLSDGLGQKFLAISYLHYINSVPVLFVAGNLFRDHKKWLEKFYSFHWMYGIIPFAIVYFIYLKIQAFGDEGHHMTNYGLFGRYIDLVSFLVFPVCLGYLF